MNKRQREARNSREAAPTNSTTNKIRRPDRPPSKSQQPTISELFSATTKPIDSSSCAQAVKLAATPPGRKRQKLDHSSPASLASENIAPESMYSFPSRNRPNGGNLIDLTSSPPNGSPKRNLARSAPRPNLHPELGAKKIVVKNLRTIPRVDPKHYFDTTWEKLNKSLGAIFNNEKIPYSLEELYKGAENVCRQNYAQELNARLEGAVQTHATEVVKGGLLQSVGNDNIQVLQEVVSAWSSWNKQMDIIRGIFFYMDRAHLLPSKKPSLQDMGVTMFRSVIFNDKQLQLKIVGGVCDFITFDRNGQSANTELAQKAVSMFFALGVYTHVIEPRLLKDSQTFVRAWAEKAVTEMDLATYLKSAVKLMDTETRRCDILGLDVRSTKRDLLVLLEDHLVQRQQDFLLNKDSIADLLDENGIEDLERLFSLLSRRQLEENIRQPFEVWIDDTGTDIVFDQKDEDSMVVRLLTMKKQLDNLWKNAFHRNTEIGHGLRKAFELFINKTKRSGATWGTDNSKPGEMIAKYVDMLLRGGVKAIPAALTKNAPQTDKTDEEDDNEVRDEDQEVNAQLDQVLDLFRFVHGKAVFEAFYKKDLARRLLMGRSASADAERSMLTRLKTECGPGFTQNLEQMFKDVELGREEMASYKSYLTESAAVPKVDLSVNILSASAWPSYPDIPVNIPKEVTREIDRFAMHYKSKHSGRRLEWKHALAHCQIRANFPKGRKEVIVSSFQAIVLLVFNNVQEDEKVSYERLLAETGLPPAELQRTLQSLACAKLRPLRKHPAGRDISTTDTFTLNSHFSHEKYRIKINQVQLKETKEENKETHERVLADRNYETQAAIVRIMKSKKTIGHQLLVAEVIEATRKRGVLDVKEIKKNIDRLIDKEYMEREEGNMYSYIA